MAMPSRAMIGPPTTTHSVSISTSAAHVPAHAAHARISSHWATWPSRERAAVSSWCSYSSGMTGTGSVAMSRASRELFAQPLLDHLRVQPFAGLHDHPDERAHRRLLAILEILE